MKTMLAITFFTHHIEGSIYFMAPLTLFFSLDIMLLLYMFVQKKFSTNLVQAFKHIGLLILVFGAFGTVTGFLQMFDALEAIKETLPIQVIAGGVKVALLNIVYATAYFSIIQAIYVGLKIASPKQPA